MVLIPLLSCLPLGMVGCVQTPKTEGPITEAPVTKEPVEEAKPSSDVPDKPDLSVMVFDTIVDDYKIWVTIKGSKESVEFSNLKAFREWLSKADIKRGSYGLSAIYDHEIYLIKIIGLYPTTLLSIKKRGNEDALSRSN